MNITTKANVGELVYYLNDNRVHSANVLSIKIVVNQCDKEKKNFVATKEQQQFWKRFGNSETIYSTCHGEWDENRIFLSHKELVESLLEE